MRVINGKAAVEEIERGLKEEASIGKEGEFLVVPLIHSLCEKIDPSEILEQDRKPLATDLVAFAIAVADEYESQMRERLKNG